MKIPHSIQERYDALLEKYKLVATCVKSVMERSVKNERWLYLYRLKEAESFYVKAQSRRWSAVKEDFFACTIVVENTAQIREAVSLLSQFFVVKNRRPPKDSETFKRPESFVFDDLRLYLTLKGRDSNAETAGLLFECQVKTFLQHAWSIATHDLIYKPKDYAGWASARVAYQVKAMLEHAEVAISEVEAISHSSILSVTNQDYEARKAVLQVLHDKGVDLGNNPNRVVDNIISLLSNWGYTWTQVWEWVLLDTAKGAGHGLNQYSFSIYEIILDSILCHDTNAITTYTQYLMEHPMQKILVAKELMEKHSEMQTIGQPLESLV